MSQKKILISKIKEGSPQLLFTNMLRESGVCLTSFQPRRE